jgi:hypothetical protein
VTIILSNNEKLYCYNGNNIENGRYIDSSEIKNFLIAEIKAKNAMLIIKPSADAGYKKTVDLLDEITKAQVKNYVISKLNKKDNEFLKK